MFPRAQAEGNIEVERKQNSLFPVGPVIKVPLSTGMLCDRLFLF